jgi:hypothetical protein
MKHMRMVPLLLLAVSACHSPPPHATAPDDALLLEVSAAERSNIAEARAACNRAKDEHAAAHADHLRMRDENSNSSRDRENASATLAKAQAALNTAVENGTTVDVENATQGVQQARRNQGIQNASATLRDKRTAHAAALARVAKEHVKVAEAQVELTKARAVNTLDRPQADKPEVSKFEASVRRAEADENVARTKSEATEREVAVTTLELQGLQATNGR